jgi:hypothetical protein
MRRSRSAAASGTTHRLGWTQTSLDHHQRDRPLPARSPASPLRRRPPGRGRIFSTSCRRRRVSIRHSWRSTFWSTYPDHVPFGVRTNSPPRRVVRRNAAAEDVPQPGPAAVGMGQTGHTAGTQVGVEAPCPLRPVRSRHRTGAILGVNCWGLVRLVEVSPTELVARVVRRKTPRHMASY